MDDRVKQMFTYTDCVQKVISYVLDWDGEQPGYLVPVAVCVNAAINSRCAELMYDQDNLQRLMARAFHLQDSLLLKIVRNISTHQATKHLLIEFVGDLASVLTCCQNEDFLLECVGILANLDLPDLNYCQLLNQYSLIPWIKSQLVPGKAEVDLVLEVVMLVGTAAGDESCSSLLCKADILLSLIELLKDLTTREGSTHLRLAGIE
ncbi:kinesin-associated protein 3-like isoform X3 [Lycorma delicatula]|uniref:kinesin-associated protein 3-like isoform X3 n=1 Tax=Lycorma delicatula TaxID=130591 RepID=UPI003F5159CA